MTETTEIKPLIQAMRRALLREHQLDVPYTALRAAYLSANGASPHATRNRKSSKPATPADEVVPPLRASAYRVDLPADWVVKKLYLVENDIGCLERLSLDPESRFILKEDWQFKARVLLIDAKVPRISRYGLPDFLSDPRQFFEAFFRGVELQTGRRVHIEDLGDDSGGDAMLIVGMPATEWEALLLRGVEGDKPLCDEAAEWAGLHHKVAFDGFTKSRAAEFCQRFLDTLLEEDANAKLEWVWPDEDSDSRMCWVDLQTGVLTVFGSPVPAGVETLDRLRVCLYEDELFDVEATRVGDEFIWKLTDAALRDLQHRKLLS